MPMLVRCLKYDCFANICGTQCKILNEGYPNGNCPFHKTQEEFDQDKEKAHDILVSKGLNNLVQIYEYNPQRRW